MLSDDVDNKDEDAERRYKRRILRELYAGMHNRRIRTWNDGYGCPFCNHKIHDAYLVFWRMQEDGPLAPSSRSILAGWRMARTPSTWRRFRIVSAACEMRCGMNQTMYT